MLDVVRTNNFIGLIVSHWRFSIPRPADYKMVEIRNEFVKWLGLVDKYYPDDFKITIILNSRLFWKKVNRVYKRRVSSPDNGGNCGMISDHRVPSPLPHHWGCKVPVWIMSWSWWSRRSSAFHPSLCCFRREKTPWIPGSSSLASVSMLLICLYASGMLKSRNELIIIHMKQAWIMVNQTWKIQVRMYIRFGEATRIDPSF